MTATGSISQADFLAGAGEMGARIREFDWRRTPLGPIESWPSSLKTSVSLILSSRHPMWIGWGPEMTFLYNDAYLHVLGAAKHPRALGAPASKVWAEIWDVCGPLADKVFERGEASFVDDVRLFMDRGDFLEETFYSFSYSPIRDETGAVSGLFCPSTDVTPKVLNTRRLGTLSELAAHSLIEKTTAAACATAARILAKNPDDVPFAMLYLADSEGARAYLEQSVGCFTEGAESAADLTGASVETAWPIAEVFQSSQRQVVSTASAAGLPKGVAGRTVREAVALPVSSRSEHQPYGVLVAGVNPCRPLDSDHLTFFELLAAQVATAIQNARAVEEEKKRADMLAEVDRAKTAFFSNVSHEFRTPLTLMLGPLENLLSKRRELPPEDREQLAITHRNSLRLLKLVNSLLDFSRLEAGRLTASYALTDLSALTADLASNFRSAIESAGLRFVVDCPRLLQPAYVDREMWERIVLNLLSNAFKFTFEGQVLLRVAEEGEDAVLTVADTGIGIPKDELPRIFERFHRVEGSKGRTYEGTGIGLALIHEYVKLHGGTITVASEPGQGTAFTVRIPLGAAHLDPGRIVNRGEAAVAAHRAQAFMGEVATWLATEPNAGAASGAAEGSAPEERPRVLLADDNADMREHVGRILSGDYDLRVAKDGQEALELIGQKRPDLVISDIMMPGLDGIGLLRAVRENPETATLPIIFLSARAGEEMRVEGLEAGADDYLVKPFTASELRARVGTHVQMSVARRRAMEREAQLRGEAEAARDQVISVLERITDGFMAIDEDWRITYVNAEAERLNGMRREEMLGRNHWELFPAPVGSTIHRELLRAARDRTPVEFENHYLPWNRWFHVKAYPARDGGLSVFYEDISTRRAAEEQLRQSEERFRQLADSMPQIVWTARPDGYIDYYNQRWYDFTGLDRDLFGDASRERALHPEDLKSWRDTWHACVATGHPYRAEFRMWDRHDGSWRWFMGRALAVRDGGGKIIKWFGTSTDIDEQKRVEDDLRRANQDLEQFAYSASHDLQEPLRSIKIYGELLVKRYGSRLDGEAYEFLDYLRTAATRMEMLVRDLLAYTQVSKLAPPPAPVDANQALSSTLANLSSAIAESGATVTCGPLPQVRVHSTHLNQLFQNLIGNAIKYRKPDCPPEVHVNAERQNDAYVFSVRDNGIGIEPDYKEEIFGLFKRLHTGDEFSGTGIGLAICERIVGRYHGRIWVESQPGQGSTFIFSIPV